MTARAASRRDPAQSCRFRALLRQRLKALCHTRTGSSGWMLVDP